MNYASVITMGVVAFSLYVKILFNHYQTLMVSLFFLSRLWYFLGGRNHYKGPVSNLPKELVNEGSSDRNASEVEIDQASSIKGKTMHA